MAAPANNSSNLRQRILTGVGLGTALLAALWWLPTPAWAVLMGFIVAAGAWEWADMIGYAGRLRIVYSVLAPLLAAALHLLPIASIALACGAFWLLLAPLWLARGWPIPKGAAGGALGWLVLAPTGFAAIYLHAYSPRLLLACILLTVIADSAAYFSGRRFGGHFIRRKLAPRISPGKSWEGVIGGAVAVALYTLAISLGLLACASACAMRLQGFAFLLFVASILGDLFESHAKRQAGIKDSGSLLPGHGGVLDRMDSLTAVLPLAFCFLVFWK